MLTELNHLKNKTSLKPYYGGLPLMKYSGCSLPKPLTELNRLCKGPSVKAGFRGLTLMDSQDNYSSTSFLLSFIHLFDIRALPNPNGNKVLPKGMSLRSRLRCFSEGIVLILSVVATLFIHSLIHLFIHTSFLFFNFYHSERDSSS